MPEDIESEAAPADADLDPCEADECCQRCGGMFLPDDVTIVDGVGPICTGCLGSR